jgi:hypothetical protein
MKRAYHMHRQEPSTVVKFYAIVIVAAALLVLALATGCSTTVAPGADPVVVRAEQTIEIAADTVDAFVRWERANEAKVSPAVHAAAENIRREFPDKFRLTRAVLRAYKNNRGPEQKALLGAYVTALVELANQANQLKQQATWTQ